MSKRTEPRESDTGPILWQVAILVVCSLPIIFYRLGNYGLVNGDEGFYHFVSRRMLETGDWLRLEFTGEHQVYETFMNAPLQYWARAAIIAAFGDSFWTMRIFSSLFALASVLMTYRLALHLAGMRAAFVAGLMQLTTYQFIYMHSARTGELEPVVCFVFTLAAYWFVRAAEEDRSFLPHHVALIALVNLKAPLVIVPVLAEVAWFAATPSAWRHIRRWVLGWWILPLGLAWHLYQYFTIGDEALATLTRMTGQASGSELQREAGVVHNLVYYARVLLFGAFPYTTLYPLAIVALRFVAPDDERRRLRLVAFFALTVLAFFTVVAKYFPWYINPSYPFFCVLTAIFLVRLRDLRDLRAVWTVLAVALSATTVIWVRLADYDPLSQRSLRLPQRLVGWQEWFDLAPALAVPLTFATACLVVGVSLRAFARRGPAPWSLALFGLLVSLASYRVLGALEDTDYVSELETIRQEIEEKRARGEPLDFPIEIHEPGRVRVRYAFGDDFVIVREPPGDADQRVFFKLIREGQTPHDPKRRAEPFEDQPRRTRKERKKRKD